MKKALLAVDLNGLVFDLFETPTRDAFVAANRPHPRDLAACALQKSFQIRGRLAAMLLLYALDDSVYAKIPIETRIEVYIGALEQDVLQGDDAWGRLWMSADVGIMGYHIVQIGAAAVTSLVALLEDESLRNRFHSSDESAALLDIYGYRLKDFAAFYIAQIKGYDLPWQPNLADRDAVIAQMRKALIL